MIYFPSIMELTIGFPFGAMYAISLVFFAAVLWNLPRDHLMVMGSGDLQLAKLYPVIVSRRFNTREGVMAEKKKKSGKKKTVKKKPAVNGKSFKEGSVAKVRGLLLGPIEELPHNFSTGPATQDYSLVLTSGPFILPEVSETIDWGVLNNSDTEQKVRVTVFKIPIGAVKTEEPPGPLEVVIQPGELWHNANQATGGFYYEVQVECSSREVFPYACAWKGLTGDPVFGTVVKSAEFIEKVG